MDRTLVHVRMAGLDRFLLASDRFTYPNLSDVTSVTVVVGSTTVYSTASDDGPVRWNTSETKRGEIVALIPTAGFTANQETASITIYSPTYPSGLLWASATIAVGDGSYFGQGGENREQCNVCGKWFPVTKLVRQLQIRRRNARANYLYSSRYTTANWEIDTDALGDTSMGLSTIYWKVHTLKNANLAGGAESFWGDGELVAKDTVDLSAFTTALLRGRFGTHQATRQPGLSVEFGFYYDYGGAGETRYSIGTKTGVMGNTVAETSDLSAISGAHIAALQAFYKVTTYDDQQIWWGEAFRLQKDETALGMTTAVSKGTPVDDSFKMKNFGALIVCPEHRMYLEKQVNDYQPTFEEVRIVETEDQEFD